MKYLKSVLTYCFIVLTVITFAWFTVQAFGDAVQYASKRWHEGAHEVSTNCK